LIFFSLKKQGFFRHNILNEKKFKGPELNFEDFTKLQKIFNEDKFFKNSSEKEKENNQKLEEAFLEKQKKFEVSKKIQEKDENK